MTGHAPLWPPIVRAALRRGAPWRLVVVLALGGGAGPAWGEPPGGPVDEGATAGTAAPASPQEATDRAPEGATLGKAVVDEAARTVTAQRDARLEALRRLARAPSTATPELLRSLFGTDLTQEAAVRAALAARAPASALVAEPADGGPADEGTGQESLDGGPPAPSVDAHEEMRRAEVAALSALLSAWEHRRLTERQRAVADEEAARLKAEAEAAAATQAQARALAEAEAAMNARLERVLGALAQVEGARSTLASARARLHDETAKELTRVDAAEHATHLLVDPLLGPDVAIDRPDQVFDGILAAQEDALERARTALERRTRQADDPVLLEALALASSPERLGVAPQGEARLGTDDPRIQDANERLLTAVEALVVEGSSFLSDRSERWFELADRSVRIAKLANQGRLVLLDRISAEKRRAITSISSDAWANLRVAVTQVALGLWFHGQRRVHDVTHLSSTLGDPLVAGALAWASLQALLLVGIALWLFRRVPRLYPRIRTSLLGRTRSTARAKLVESLLGIVEDAGPRVVTAAVAAWVFEILRPVGPEVELRLALELTLWIVGYQVVALLTHRLILRLARRRLSLTVPTKLRVLRTVRVVVRYGFLSGYALATLRELLGAGVLFALGRNAVFAGAVVVVFVLVRRWRADITEAYLRGWPDTRLAHAVESSRERWYGLFVSVAALSYVTARGAVAIARDFALGFDQTRQALAYLFRLRVERQAKKEGVRPPSSVADLPDDVRAVFADRPCEDDGLYVERSTPLAKMLEELCGTRGRVAAFHATYGMGRTTLLKHFVDAAEEQGIRASWWRPARRLLSAEMLRRDLIELLDLDPEGCKTGEELRARLLEGPRSVVVVDGVEWFFLRALHGYRALDELIDLASDTRTQVSWVLSLPTTTWEFLARARHLDEQVGTVHRLDRWSEEDVRQLIARRQRRLSREVRFDDLLVHNADQANLGSHVVETQEGYIRLLWNAAEGNPRLANHYWLRSLELAPGGAFLKVRLYDAPTADDLEDLPEADRFLLAALVLHRVLRVEEAARAAGIPVHRAEQHFGRALDRGIYVPYGEGDDRVQLSTDWWGAAMRFLRRKNLLAGRG